MPFNFSVVYFSFICKTGMILETNSGCDDSNETPYVNLPSTKFSGNITHNHDWGKLEMESHRRYELQSNRSAVGLMVIEP